MVESLSTPGPQSLPIFGAAVHMLRFVTDPIGYAGRLFRDYGPIAALVRGRPTRVVSTEPNVPGTVFVYGPELNKALLTNHADFHKCALTGPLYPQEPLTQRTRPLTRTLTGLFHVNGDDHRAQRRLMMPAFHRSRIATYRDEMASITESLLENYRVGAERDLRADMMEVTLRIATGTLFGADLGETGLAIGRDLQRWLEEFGGAVALPWDFPGTPYRRWLELSLSIDARMTAVIAQKRKELGTRGDMLSMLIEAQDEAGGKLTEDELIGHASVIFAAGHETSSNALCWTLLMLAQHPQIFRNLYDELHGRLKGEAPSLEDLAELPLLDRVVKESLRLFPPAPFNHRVVPRACELLGNPLPANTEILASIYHTHRMPEFFPDPLRFNPERWSNLDPGPYVYNPFSAGPRMCIGATFALMEIKIVLALLVQRFRFELVPGQKIDRFVSVTMAPRPALRMRIERADGAYAGPVKLRGNVSQMFTLGAN